MASLGALAIAWTAAACGGPAPAHERAAGAPVVIGGPGTAPGQFSSPRGIDIASDGTIAVVDKSGRVQLLDPDGAPIRHWVLPKIDNGTPTALTFDESDPEQTTLIVPDTHNGRIFRYALDGTLLATIEGENPESPSFMIFPTDVAVDDDGNLYAVEYGGPRDRIVKFDRDGRFLFDWSDSGAAPGQIKRAMALTWISPDRLLVADSINHRFQLFTAEGELVRLWGEVGEGPGQFRYPYDFAVHHNGRIYVMEYGGNRLHVTDFEGRPLGIYGGPGRIPGTFHTPWGIAVAPDGRLFIADTGNNRLQVLDPKTPIGVGLGSPDPEPESIP